MSDTILIVLACVPFVIVLVLIAHKVVTSKQKAAEREQRDRQERREQ